MGGEMGFSLKLRRLTAPVWVMIRGELAIGAHVRAGHLYAVRSDPDHDAVMRIGGKAPGGGPILSVGISAMFVLRLPATSDRPDRCCPPAIGRSQ